MADGVRDRTRVTLPGAPEACPRCGADQLRRMRSRDVRAGLDQVNPFWNPREKTYQRCRSCGFRRTTGAGALAEPAVGRPRPGMRPLGWAAVVLLLIVVAVLTVVLAGMLLVVSVWLTVAVPVVVMLAVLGLAVFARRG